jgi:hypothetical protein
MADIVFKSGRTFFEIDNTVAAMFVECGAADYRVTRPPDPRTAHQPRGWSLIRKMDAQGREKLLFLFSDGHGGQLCSDRVPGPRKVWKYDPQTEQEGYVDEPTDVPPELIKQFLALGGGNNNPFADLDAGAARQQKLIEAEALQESQNRQANTLLHIHGVKK